MPRVVNPLTPKQAKFVREYLVDLNATNAAIRAGYSRKYAGRQGYTLLQIPHVAKAVSELRTKALAKTEVTIEAVIKELAAIGFSDVRKLFDDDGNLIAVNKLDAETAAQISGVDVEVQRRRKGDDDDAETQVVKVRRFDKIRALELLGKHKGAFSDPPPPPHVGPGMTVIVQQGVQVDGGRVVSAQRVAINLPPPAK